MLYNFNGEGFQSNDSYKVGSDFSDALSLVVKAVDGDGKEFTITQEPVNFLWQANKVD